VAIATPIQGSARRRGQIPDCATGARIRAIRWLHPGYEP
jgi:hypothetical protein